MKQRAITYGFVRPILWGLERGWSVQEIAQGLEIRERTVIEAVECFGPWWLAGQIRRSWTDLQPIPSEQRKVAWPWRDPAGAANPVTIADWAYANWFRARMGASECLNAMGEI